MTLRGAFVGFVALLLVPCAASAQSTKVLDPSTGLPVFSAANPAPVTTTAVVPGTAATSLGKAEDAAATSGDTGVLALGIANEAQTTKAADGDYIAFSTDTKGNAVVVGAAATGAAAAGNPVLVGGSDGTNARSLKTGTAGNLLTSLYDSTGANAVAVGLAQTGAWQFQFSNGIQTNSTGYNFDGSNWYPLLGNLNGAAITKGLASTRWRYTSGASPILSNTTTAVTIKAAVASVKNAIDSCQLTTTAFTASVPLAIRDGAGGTVMWALTVPTAGFLQPVNIVFEQPLVGTVNTLLEVVTTTANTAGTVTFNCQGHTET